MLVSLDDGFSLKRSGITLVMVAIIATQHSQKWLESRSSLARDHLNSPKNNMEWFRRCCIGTEVEDFGLGAYLLGPG